MEIWNLQNYPTSYFVAQSNIQVTSLTSCGVAQHGLLLQFWSFSIASVFKEGNWEWSPKSDCFEFGKVNLPILQPIPARTPSVAHFLTATNPKQCDASLILKFLILATRKKKSTITKKDAPIMNNHSSSLAMINYAVRFNMDISWLRKNVFTSQA